MSRAAYQFGVEWNQPLGNNHLGLDGQRLLLPHPVLRAEFPLAVAYWQQRGDGCFNCVGLRRWRDADRSLYAVVQDARTGPDGYAAWGELSLLMGWPLEEVLLHAWALMRNRSGRFGTLRSRLSQRRRRAIQAAWQVAGWEAACAVIDSAYDRRVG